MRKLSQDIRNILNIQEDNIFIQAKNYGVSGVFKNFISKLFGLGATKNFNSLITSIDFAVKTFEVDGICQKDTEEFINKALHQCRQEDGACVTGVFFDAVNTALMLILDQYIDLLNSEGIKITNIDSFKSLANIKSSDQKVVKELYNNYMTCLSRDNYNKFFFKIRSATITPAFIRNKITTIDNYIVNAITNKSGKRISISKI
jgi:hypothetical protein